MARLVRNGIARQPSADGVLPLCQPDLSTAHASGHLQGDWADGGPGSHTVVVQYRPLDRLVLDWWICHGIDIAANRASKCRFVFSALCILLGEIPHRVVIAILPASLFAPGDLGRLSRPANCSDQIEIGTFPGIARHPPHHSHLEQSRLVDSQLGVELAGMVSGGDGLANNRFRQSGEGMRLPQSANWKMRI